MTATTTTGTGTAGTTTAAAARRRTILKRPQRLSKFKVNDKPPTRPLLLRNLRIHYGTRRRPSGNGSRGGDTTAEPQEPPQQGDPKVVRFAPKVRIKRIPSRHEYEADNVKTLLWFTREQLRELVHRNTIQAQREPMDWRDIAEEDSDEEDDCSWEDESSLEDD